MERRLNRQMGVTGLVFVAIFIVSSFMTPNTPNAHASIAKVVSFYHEHRGGVGASAWMIELAIVVGVYFFWHFRGYLSRADDTRGLATLGFVGAVLFAVSGGIAAGVNFALSSAADHVAGTTMQTLSVLQNGLNMFMAGAGVALFLAASGIACIRGAALSRWIGWVAVVLAIVSLALPFIASPAAGVWVLIASIAILLGEREVDAPSAGAGAPVGTAG